ncbi:MAG: magnesium transporter [Candidatus Bathyarchaeia archaeon]
MVTGRTLEDATYLIVEDAPFVLLVIPAFINMAGVLATVFSSRLTSRLFIGTIDRHFRPRRLLAFDLLAISAVALSGFTLLAVIVILATRYFLFILIDATLVFGAFLTAGLTATIAMCIVGIIVAYLSFSKGLNPDNFTAPFTSTLGDMAGTLILIFSVKSFSLV